MKETIESGASEAVARMFDGQVAFFNIGKKHAFFLCSPDEARHGMDSIRAWRDQKSNLKTMQAERDAFKAQMMAQKAWENAPCDSQVISTCGILSLAALNVAFSAVECKFTCIGPKIDVIIVSGLRFADIRGWGGTVCDYSGTESQQSRGIFATVFNADVYIDNKLPEDVVLIGSMPCDGWKGGFSRITVVPDDPRCQSSKRSKVPLVPIT